VVLQLDNGYDDTAEGPAPSRPSELVAPLRAAAADEKATTARQQLAIAARRFDKTRCPGVPENLPTYVHIAPTAEPGVEAPLGWSLSDEARRSLRSQLRRRQNQCSLVIARAWLAGSRATPHGYRCAAGSMHRRTQDGRVAAVDVEVCVTTRSRCVPRPELGRVEHPRRNFTVWTKTDPYGAFSAVMPGYPLSACWERREGGSIPCQVLESDRNERSERSALATGRLLTTLGKPLAPASTGQSGWAYLIAGAYVALLVLVVLGVARASDHEMEA
jgi:hypothetical protein